MRKNLVIILSLSLAGGLFTSCSKERSSTTGWNYNDANWGGYEVSAHREQETGPNLVYIPGGMFTMGQAEQDVTYEADMYPRRVSVNAFYMDETEVSNKDYREYLHWVERVFLDYPQVYEQALPDTLVWRHRLAYNEPYVRFYFRHPAYNDYPVVGVSWLQATNYAAWRTDRVNEMIMIREGILSPHTAQQIAEDNFNTEAYLAGQYQGLTRRELRDPSGNPRQVRMEDGIMLPEYRLPTEAEWEYAALALAGNGVHENINTRRMLPWNGYSMRKEEGKYRGKMQANYQRGRGDMMGVASSPNDQSAGPAHIRSYWPNDFGLYNMAGNVSEWVMDVYRPLTFEDMAGLNPFRGNQFQVPEKDVDGFYVEKDSLGRIRYRDVTIEENVNRRNYQESDQRGFLDPMTFNQGEQGYEYGVSSLINDQARVYKGGSWMDRAYWLGPGTRRFLDQEQRSPAIGFRCAMIRVGDTPGHNQRR